jgi:hypothetical protein
MMTLEMNTFNFCLLMFLWVILLYEDHRLFKEYARAQHWVGVFMTQILGVLIIMTMIFATIRYYEVMRHVGH